MSDINRMLSWLLIVVFSVSVTSGSGDKYINFEDPFRTDPPSSKIKLDVETPIGAVKFIAENETILFNKALNETNYVLLSPGVNATWPTFSDVVITASEGPSVTLTGGEDQEVYYKIGVTLKITATLAAVSRIVLLVDYTQSIYLEQGCTTYKKITLERSFAVANIYTLNINGNNFASNASSALKIHIVHPTTGIEILDENKVVNVGENASFEITVDGSAAQPMSVQTMTRTCRPGESESVNFTIASHQTITSNCSYSSPGIYQAHLVVEDQFGANISRSVLFSVNEPCNVTQKMYFKVGEPPEVCKPKVGFDYHIDFGEGQTLNGTEYDNSALQLPATFGYEPGNYSVFVISSRFVIVAVTQCVVYQHPLLPSQLTHDQVLIPAGNVTFFVETTSGTGLPAPTHLACDVSYDQGATVRLNIDNLTTVGTRWLEFNHTFTSSGTYLVQLNCSNMVSSLNISTTVVAKDFTASDVSADIPYFSLMNNTDESTLDIPLNFSFLSQPPPNLMYAVSPYDGQPLNLETLNTTSVTANFVSRADNNLRIKLEYYSTENTISSIVRSGILQLSKKTAAHDGQRNITVFEFEIGCFVLDQEVLVSVQWDDGSPDSTFTFPASATTISRPVTARTKSVTHMFQDQKLVTPVVTASIASGTEVLKYSAFIVIRNAIVDITTTILRQYSYNESIVADFKVVGNYMPLIHTNCTLTHPDGTFSYPVYQNYDGASIEIQIPKSSAGLKSAKIECSNELSQFVKTVDYKIVCFSSSVLFGGMHRTNDTAEKVFSHVRQYTTGRLSDPCLNASLFKFHWTLTDSSNNVVSMVQPNSYRIYPHDYLSLAGIYRISLNVSMPSVTDEFMDDFLYLDYTFPPLEATIAGGSEKSIGKGQQLELDGQTNSFDPNVGLGNSDPKLTFLWKCYVLSDGAKVTQYLKPTYNLTDHRNEPPCSVSIPSLGKTSLDSSGLTVETWALIELTVKKDEREKSTLQAIKILSEPPPEGSIKCLLNCQAKFVPDAVSKFVVETKCTGCSYISYKWTVFKFNPSTNEDEKQPWTNRFTSGNTSEHFNALENAFDEGSTYLLKVEISSPGKPSGQASYRLFTNARPYGGACSVIPTKGLAFSDDFYVSCSNWKDEGNRPNKDAAIDIREPMTYRVTQYIGDKEAVVSLGGERSTPTFKLQLCRKEEDFQCPLIVAIIDLYGFTAHFNLSVTSKSPMASLTAPLPSNSSSNPNAEAEAEKSKIASIDQLTASSETSLEGRTASEKALIASTVASILNDVPTVKTEVETVQVSQVNDTSSVSDLLIASLKSDEPLNEKLSQGLEKMVGTSTETVTSALSNGTVAIDDVLKFSTTLATSVPKPEIVSERAQDMVLNVAERLSDFLVQCSKKSQNQNDILATLGGVTSLQDSLITIGSPEVPVEDEEFELQQPEADEGFNRIELNYFRKFKNRKKKVEARKRERKAKKSIEINTKLWENSFSILENFTLPEKETRYEKKTFTLRFLKATVNTVLESIKNETEKFDSTGTILNIDSLAAPDNTEVKLKNVVLKKNIYIQGESSNLINRPVVKTQIVKTNGEGPVSPRFVTATFKDESPTNFKRVVPKFIPGDASRFFYQKTLYRNKKEHMCLLVKPEIDSVAYDFFWRSLIEPTDAEYDFFQENVERESDGKTFVVCLKPGQIKRKGTVFLGMRPRIVEIPQSVSSRRRRSASNTTSGTEDDELTTPFLINFQSFTCFKWSGAKQDWNDEDCTVERNTIQGITTCTCKGGPDTVISSSFFVAPNAIDFATVFSKFDIKSQGAVLGTILIILFVAILLALWGRWKDSFDVLQWGVTVLEDNCKDDNYFYMITVYTGFVKEGGTLSNVSFNLYGETDDTDVRDLSDGVRKGFGSGSVVHFLMAVPRCLGNLQYLRIWHDNSGKGRWASWNLNRVEVVDIQKNETFIFICNGWLSVEEGSIDRALPLCGADNMKNFKTMFFEHARNHVTEDHIWLSVMFRPVKSHFSRVQRVCCCATLLYLSMIANAIYFDGGDSKDRQRSASIELGPIKFNPSQVYVSFVTAVITAIPVYVIIMMFRKSKLKPWERKQRKVPQWLPKVIKDKLEFSQRLEDVLVIGDNILITDATLPSWCVYIGWALCLLASFSSAFFIMLYSMQWGKDLSEEWLTTFFLSFFQSILCVDPFKVLTLAVIAALLLAKFKTSKPSEYDLAQIKEFNFKHGKENVVRRCISSRQPVLDANFQRIKAQKLRDEQMKRVIRELILNIVFLFLLSCILYSNRDTQSYNLNTYVINNYLEPPKPYRKYDKIIQESHYFEWLNQTVIESLFPENNYLGVPLSPRQRLFSYDSANLKVGPPRLRQLRSSNTTCDYPYAGSRFCIPGYEITGEETGSHCPGWTERPCTDSQESTLTIDAWTFVSSTDIWGVPVAGLLGVYGGGGYIANLDVNRIVCLESLKELHEKRWIDRHTRAVFLEFTLYNVDINMFVYSSFLTEFPPSGGVLTYKNIFPFRPSQHVGTTGKFILVCEIVTLLQVVVSIGFIIFRFAKVKWMYFAKFWNVVEFVMVCVSIVAVVFFILRQHYTQSALDAYNEYDREFVNFYHVVVWDYAFVYVLGILVTIATMRLLKALAYTDITFRVFSVLRSTMKYFPGFSICIVVTLVSFACAGYSLFGRTSAPYMSLVAALETMFVGLLGDATFKQTDAEAHMEPIEIVYFSLFVMVVTITATNLFLAILIDVMTKSQEDTPTEQKVNYNIFSYMWNSVAYIIKGTSPDYTYNNNEYNDNSVLTNFQRNLQDSSDHLSIYQKLTSLQMKGGHDPVPILGKSSLKGGLQ